MKSTGAFTVESGSLTTAHTYDPNKDTKLNTYNFDASKSWTDIIVK